MEAVLRLIIGAIIILAALIISQYHTAPKLIGPEISKNNAPMKTYKIIDSKGNQQVIMTSKSMKELLQELDYLAYKKECTT